MGLDTVSLRLEPEYDVERRGGRFFATTTAPWLGVEGLAIETFAGRFIDVTYRGSLWDEPARPVFRFWRDGEAFVDHIAAGPVAGSGLWTGRVPPGTKRMSVSPTNRPGPFDFMIERAKPRRWGSLLAEGSRLNRKSTRSAVLTRLIGWSAESDVNLAWAIGSTPLSAYDAWQARRLRPIGLEEADRPRFDWARGPPIRLIVLADEAAAGAIHRTLASLAAQVFPYWTALVVGGPEPQDPRIRSASGEAALEWLGQGGIDALTGRLEAADILPPHALAYLAEQAHRHPACQLFYGDALHRGTNGTLTPVMRPGWSPRLGKTWPDFGPSAFLRGVEAWTPEEHRGFLAVGTIPERVVGALTPEQAKPLRRIMIETNRPDAIASPRMAPLPDARSNATAAIIIPTRDHPFLLRRAVASIRRRSSPGRYRIVVIDNGSLESDAMALLGTLRQSPDVLVIEHPGPFNFSLICNKAAAASHGDVLIFLNDDTEVLSEGWLERLIAHAMDPATGAVGAKLTRPDGRLQHIGVLVGMGESAGHFGALAPGDDPGWAGRNLAVHEVSAVTGACLAVARDKFDAVGGFDAVQLPIELSDVDLCLKLNARGWQTIIDPFVHLMHEESVSRGGATLRRLDVYGSQRAVFIERWRHVLRDDPAFHPGLSLYSCKAALG